MIFQQTQRFRWMCFVFLICMCCAVFSKPKNYSVPSECTSFLPPQSSVTTNHRDSILSLPLGKLLSTAKNGDTFAQAIAGFYYWLGVGTSKNEALLYQYAVAASKDTVPLGMYLQAMCLYDGLGCQKQRSEAQTILAALLPSLRVDSITPDAGYRWFAMATLYEYSLGVRSYADSIQYWYRKSSERGFAPAQYRHGQYLLSVAQTLEDSTKALLLIKTSATNKYPQALYWLGSRMAKDTSTLRQGIVFIRAAAQLGYPPAEYTYGAYLYAGIGVAQDSTESLRWFVSAADKGFAPSAAELAYRFKFGVSLEQSFTKSFQWFIVANSFASDPQSRSRLLPFIHQQIQSLDTVLPNSSIDSAYTFASTVINHWRNADTQKNYLSALYLHGGSRKFWRRVSCRNFESLPEIIGFSKNGDFKILHSKNSTISTVQGKWNISPDGATLKRIASGNSDYAIEFIAPGMILLRQATPSHSERELYEAVLLDENQLPSDIRVVQQNFAVPMATLKRVDVSDSGTITCVLRLDNIPIDGMSISAVSLHIPSLNTNADVEANWRTLRTQMTYYDDGEYRIEWNIAEQLPMMKVIEDATCSITLAWQSESLHQVKTITSKALTWTVTRSRKKQ